MSHAHATTIAGPTRVGAWWVSFDDGDQVVEAALLFVEPYHGQGNFDDGGTALFLDGTGRHFVFRKNQEIVQPGVTVPTACGTGFSRRDEWRITWLREVKPPRNAPKAGSSLASDRSLAE